MKCCYKLRVASMVLVAFGLLVFSNAYPAQASSEADGVTFYPELSLVRGDHRLDLDLAIRYRYEYWHAPQSPGDNNIHGLRTTFGLRYSWKDAISIYVEGRDTRAFSLQTPPNTGGGAAGLYKAFTVGGLTGTDTSAGSVRVSNAYVQAKLGDSQLRAGRVAINMGTTLGYQEPNWNYVKKKRMSQRLVGTVGWRTAERMYDGAMGHFDFGGFHGELFAAQPTTGVFDLSRAYRTQDGLLVYGAELTAKRGTWFDNAEINAFFIGYQDSRATALATQGIVDSKILLYTFGASMLLVEPVGPGQLDVMLWGAGQLGDFGTARQGAWAFLTEFGYQLDEVFAEPWLRVGVNYASGDSNPAGGTRNTFFNLLPTNHLYYGYMDQFAFSNLVDFLVQFKAQPHERLGLEVVWHRFWLAEPNDGRYFGSGAFSRDDFGYGASASGGSQDVGNELDVVASFKISQHVSVLAGVAQLWGGRVFDTAANQNGTWAFTQVSLKY